MTKWELKRQIRDLEDQLKWTESQISKCSCKRVKDCSTHWYSIEQVRDLINAKTTHISIAAPYDKN